MQIPDKIVIQYAIDMSANLLFKFWSSSIIWGVQIVEALKFE